MTVLSKAMKWGMSSRVASVSPASTMERNVGKRDPEREDEREQARNRWVWGRTSLKERR